MEREQRYIVLKLKDIDAAKFSEQELNDFNAYCDKIAEARAARGKPPLYCVVVEAHWPEYESVWSMIEARVDKQ